MYQEIITYCILSITFLYIIYNSVKFFKPVKPLTYMNKCDASCAGCSLSKATNKRKPYELPSKL